MISISVSQSSFNNLSKYIKQNILAPKIKQICNGVRSDIAFIADDFRGVGSPSIADKGATTQVINKRRLTGVIKPVPGTEQVFKVNRDGFNDDVYISKDNQLVQSWVNKKYPNHTGKWLRVRGNSTICHTLGTPERDIFSIAFKNLIDRDRDKYELI